MTVQEITEKAIAYQRRMRGSVTFQGAVQAVTRDEKQSQAAEAERARNAARAQGVRDAAKASSENNAKCQDQAREIVTAARDYQREQARIGINVSDFEAVRHVTSQEAA